MRQDGDVARNQQPEKDVLQAGRHDVMRRFDQDVARAIERRDVPVAEPGDEIGCNMDVGALDQAEWNVLLIKNLLQRFEGSGGCQGRCCDRRPAGYAACRQP